MRAVNAIYCLVFLFCTGLFIYSPGSFSNEAYRKQLAEKIKNADKEEFVRIIGEELERIRREKYKNQPSLEEVTARAENGDIAAQNELGKRYLSAINVEIDIQKSYDWYRKAADAGNPEAQYWVGDLIDSYAKDLAKEERLRQAVEWYRKSAEAGYSSAQFRLGYYYQTGKGVEKNLKTAASWYEKASLNENYGAMACLGLLYADGKGGVKKDIVLGMAWELAGRKLIGGPGLAYQEQFDKIWESLNARQRESAEQISMELVKRIKAKE